ncbi:hypothetical protein SMSP1_01459 [Sedimentisphaera salicampi]|nr:hypothetical protein SMSP1_01459 [Sedimentisphaera salicampi]
MPKTAKAAETFKIQREKIISITTAGLPEGRLAWKKAVSFDINAYQQAVYKKPYRTAENLNLFFKILLYISRVYIKRAKFEFFAKTINKNVFFV